MQDLLVVSLLALAAFFLGRRLWRTLRSAIGLGCGCGCGCSGCSPQKKPAQHEQQIPMFKP